MQYSMEQKERISITIDKRLLKWIDERIDGRVFANRSHGLEFLARRKIKSESGSSSDNPVNPDNFWGSERT
jgi:metal-responsive CopG/Arc/MetJ family transcriptional regulator